MNYSMMLLLSYKMYYPAQLLSKNSVTVAKMMLGTVKTKDKEALEQLDKIRKKQKTVDKKTHDLLDQALPSEDVTQTKRKSEAEEKSVKKVKRK